MKQRSLHSKKWVNCLVFITPCLNLSSAKFMLTQHRNFNKYHFLFADRLFRQHIITPSMHTQLTGAHLSLHECSLISTIHLKEDLCVKLKMWCLTNSKQNCDQMSPRSCCKLQIWNSQLHKADHQIYAISRTNICFTAVCRIPVNSFIKEPRACWPAPYKLWASAAQCDGGWLCST